MGLDLVSQTYSQDRGARKPAHRPIFPFEPPIDLARAKTFSAGQPFETFNQMRENAPVMWHAMDKANMEGFWALTSFADVQAASLNTAVFSSQKGGILMAYPPKTDPRHHPKLHSASLDTMICLDAPHHMQLRREHMTYFKPNYVRDLKAKVDLKVTKILDGLAASGPVTNFVENFSSHLPLFTLSEMLGIPESDRPKIRQWMDMLEMAPYMLEDKDISEIAPSIFMHFLSEMQAMFDYGQYILKKRRKNPRQDLLSAIANVEIDGEQLADEFLDGSWLLILVAGNDTTRNSISGLMKLLTQFPQEKAKLIANPNLITNMAHEGVRMVSPVMYMRRTAAQDTEIGGQKIAEGEKIILYYGAANRDPAMFENPNIFDVNRANAKDHIGFGTGPHVCLGQRIANMQIEAAYRQILTRFPNISWTGEEEILPNGFTHSIGKLMVDIGT